MKTEWWRGTYSASKTKNNLKDANKKKKMRTCPQSSDTPPIPGQSDPILLLMKKKFHTLQFF